MAIERVVRPYEALFRWNDERKLVGAHVQFITELVEDGKVLSANVGEALPVAVGEEEGFPVADVLGPIQAGAVVAADAASADAKSAREEAAQAQKAQAEAEGQLATALGNISRLEDALKQQQAVFNEQATRLQLEAVRQGERAMGLQQQVDALTAELEAANKPVEG